MQTDGFIKRLSINNLSAHTMCIIRLGLKMKFIIKNQLPYEEMKGIFISGTRLFHSIWLNRCKKETTN